MPAIPPTGDFPKATIDKDTFHAKFLAVHAYLTGLLGSDGVAATARAQLGLGSVATKAVTTDVTLAANSDANVPTEKAAKAYMDAARLAAWPVGSVFIAVVATSPSTLLGGGTWVAFGTGRVLVGFDAAQTEFDTVEETGGAKTHTLSASEIPAHTHPIPVVIDGSAGIFNTGIYYGNKESSVSSSATGLSTGGGGAHNNLQPYIVVHMWKRTA